MKRTLRTLPLLFLFLLPCARAAHAQDPRFVGAEREAARRLSAAEAAGEPAAAQVRALKAWAAALRSAAARATPADTATLAVSSRGTAWLLRAGQRLPARETALLREGDALQTGPDGLLEVRFEDGSRLVLGPDAELSFARLPRPGVPTVSARLLRGRVYWEVGALLQGRAELQSPLVAATLAAGALEARALPDGRLEVLPLEGRAELRARAPRLENPWWDRAP